MTASCITVLIVTLNGYLLYLTATAGVTGARGPSPQRRTSPPIVWPPPLTAMRRLAARLIPVPAPRHLYWRYGWSGPSHPALRNEDGCRGKLRR